MLRYDQRNIGDWGCTVHNAVGTVRTRAARELQRGGHGTMSPILRGICSGVSYPKSCPLRSGGRGTTEFYIPVVNRPALGILEDANDCSWPTALDAPSQVPESNEDSVGTCGSLRTVEFRRPGTGGPSPRYARASTACERHLRLQPVPAVREQCKNRSPFSRVARDVEVIKSVKGSSTDGYVGSLVNSDRNIGGSQIQQLGGKTVTEFEETIESQ